MMRRLHSHQLAGVRAQRGFSLFEFGVAASLFALLVGIATNRLSLVAEEAERVAAEQLISTLRVALQLKVAHAAVAAQPYALATVADENPIAWLAQTPKNYLGEYYLPGNKNLKAGYWYFDRTEKTLVYLLSHRNSFALGSSILLKFKVESLRLPTIPAKQAPAAEFPSLALVQVVGHNSVGGQ